MAHVGLYGAGIVASVGQGVPAGMAELVRVWSEAEAGRFPVAFQEVVHLSSIEGFASLGEEQEGAF